MDGQGMPVIARGKAKPRTSQGKDAGEGGWKRCRGECSMLRLRSVGSYSRETSCASFADGDSLPKSVPPPGKVEEEKDPWVGRGK